jgi:hypothetical protein
MSKQATKVKANVKAVSEPKVVSELKTRSDFVDEIWASYRNSVEHILRMGRTLIAARAALVHGQFLEMIRSDLPFTASTAERLMKIASDKNLSNPAHVQLLPASWGTLYELTKLKDAEFEQALSSGAINSRMTRGNAVKMLAAPAPANKVTAPANKVQKALEHLYKLASDTTVVWTEIDWDMVDDLIEQLQSRLNANNATAAEAKEWAN